MINEIFDNNPNLLGIMDINNEHFVHFHIEDDYVIPAQDLPKDVSVKGPTKHNNLNYVIISSKTVSLDDLISIVENILLFNREKKTKEALFEETLKSLQKIFNSSSVDELKSLVTTLNTKTEVDE